MRYCSRSFWCQWSFYYRTVATATRPVSVILVQGMLLCAQKLLFPSNTKLYGIRRNRPV